MQTAKCLIAAALVSLPCSAAWAAQGEGLTPNADNLPWARWQGRFAIGVEAPDWRGEWGVSHSLGLKPRGLSLMGDYFFSRSLHEGGGASGFRATSGLVIGARPTLWIGPTGRSAGAALSLERRTLADPNADSAALPYLGVGYSGLTGRGGWSFSADFGLVAGSPSVRLGRSPSSAAALDEQVRDLRLSPVLQVGASYSF